MSFPAIPAQLKAKFDTDFPGFWDWYQAAKKVLDMLDSAKGGSLIWRNNAGTVTKRIRMNDLGDGILFEDL